MRRVLVVSALGVIALLSAVPSKAGTLHEVTVNNYDFQDDATGATKLVVNEGDQIRFTVREGDYPPHSANVDDEDLGVKSGDLLLFETYTTPPLRKPGTYTLYCKAHRDRDHETTLTVNPVEKSAPAPAKSTKPKTTTSKTQPKQATQPEEGSGATTPQGEPAGEVSDPVASGDDAVVGLESVDEGVVPSGKGVATDRRKAAPDPNSVQALLGRDFSEGGVWTRAVTQAVLAAFPIFAAAAFALRRDARRRALAIAAEAYAPVVVVSLDEPRMDIRPVFEIDEEPEHEEEQPLEVAPRPVARPRAATPRRSSAGAGARKAKAAAKPVRARSTGKAGAKKAPGKVSNQSTRAPRGGSRGTGGKT